MAKKVLLIVGSLRKNSFNRQLAQEIEKLINDRAEVSYLSFSDLPYMNQDIEFPAPKEVERVRREVESADGVWFITPEYNSSYPGLLKNLLDWLSRPLKQGDFGGASAISGKKAAVSGAAGQSAASGARQKLRELLSFIRTEVVAEDETGVALCMEAFQSNRLILSEAERELLKKQAERFLGSI